MTSSFLLLFLLALAQLLSSVLSSSTGTLCILMYSLPGNVDFPFSIAYNLPLTYDPIPTITTNSTYFNISFLANGTRSYTNRFGVTTSTTVSVLRSSPVLYSGAVPLPYVDLTVATPFQVPGYGQLITIAEPSLLGSSSVYEEGWSAHGLALTGVLDPSAQAYLSSIPGFVNSTIPASNVNSLAVDYVRCRAPITFSNGLRAPVQPSASNSAQRYLYSYAISDGVSYSLAANLTLTMSSTFTASDPLGNPYQQVVDVGGTRSLVNLSSGETTVQNVIGLANKTIIYNGLPPSNNTFYPFSFLASAPGVYSMNTAPFWDRGGLIYAVEGPPSSPALFVWLQVEPFITAYSRIAVLTDSVGDDFGVYIGAYTSVPSFQRQAIALL